MKESARNVAVGLTVIIALILLCGMIILFTGLPEQFQPGYTIKIHADATHDTRTGASVHLAGMRVGYVTDIEFTDRSAPMEGVTLTARIDHDIDLPAETIAVFFTKGLTGQAYIQLKPEGPPVRDPRTGQPLAYFPRDGSIVMDSKHVPSGLPLPQELLDALPEIQKGFKNLGDLAKTLNDLLAPAAGAPTDGQPASQPDQAAPSLQSIATKLDSVLTGLNNVFGDPKSQQDLKESLANLAAASASAKDAMEQLKAFAVNAGQTLQQADSHMNELTARLIQTADQISKLMATLNEAAMKMAQGDGTAGKLLNDPKLYEDLVEATRQLSELVKEFRLMIAEWKEKGVKIQLK